MSCTKSVYKLFLVSSLSSDIHTWLYINVSYGELVTQNTTSSTTWQYCPSQFGTYTISVVGNNSAGEGEITTTSLHVPGGIIIMVTNV